MTQPEEYLRRWLDYHKHHFMYEDDYRELKEMALEHEHLQEALYISSKGDFAELDRLHDELHSEYAELQGKIDELHHPDEVPEDMDARESRINELKDERDKVRLRFEKEAVKFFANNTDAQISTDSIF